MKFASTVLGAGAGLAVTGTASAATRNTSTPGGDVLDYLAQQGITATQDASSRAALAALATTSPAILTESGREGLFVFDSANLSSKATADPLQGIYVAPASDTTGASGAWVRRFTGPLWVTWYGAVADGVTDNAPAIQAAIDAANGQGGGEVQLPEGTLIINAAVQPKPNVILRGRGRNITILKVGVDNIRGLDRHPAGRSGYCGVEDFTIWGYADRNMTLGPNETRNFIGPFVEAWFSNIEVIYCRMMSISADATRITVTGCYVRKSMRDAINLTGCTYAKVTNNTIEEAGDDAIAIHVSAAAAGTKDESIIVTGNRIQKSAGIKLLGARNAVVSNNSLRFYWGYAVQVGMDANFDEGVNSKFSVVITDNTATDGMNANVVGGGVVNYAIWLNGSRSTGNTGLPVPVGEYNPATQAFVLPAPYVNTVGVGAARAANIGFVVANNTVTQTLGPLGADGNPATKCSDFGFGDLWWHSGPIDPPVTTLIRTVHGVYVTGSWENLRIDGNDFNGLQWAVNLQPNVFRNVSISNNTMFRCQSGVRFNLTSAIDVSCVIDGNDINLDPYCESPQRTTPLNGGWTVSGFPWYAFTLDWTRGCVVRNNCVRNVMGVVKNANGAVCSVDENHFFWDWSSGNKGIGIFGTNPGTTNYSYFVDSNPTSANYLDYSAPADSAFVRAASAMPSSGYYRAGQIVRNTSPTKDASNMVLEGWQRLTSGNSHVLGTDWAQRYVSHVSPAT